MDIQQEIFKYIHTSDLRQIYEEISKIPTQPLFWNSLYSLINTEAPAIAKIKKFVEGSNCRKWAVFSDYVFHGQNVHNDVASFAIIPFTSHPRWKNYDAIRNLIKQKIPHDAKHYGNANPIPEGVAKAIGSIPALNVSFLLPQKWSLFGDKTTDLCRIRLFLDTIMKCLLVWAGNAQNEKRQAEHLKNCKIINGFLARPEQEWKLPKVRQVILVAILAAFIQFLVERTCRGGKIMWGTDRDSIFDWPDGKHKGTIYAIEECLLHNLLSHDGIPDSSELVYAEPAFERNSKSIWYDEFNRLADFAGGALAMLDIKRNEQGQRFVPGSKFDQYFRHVIANNRRFVTFLINPCCGSCKELDFGHSLVESDSSTR